MGSMSDEIKHWLAKLRRTRTRVPQRGDVWWIKDSDSGVKHKKQGVIRHPALIVRGASGSMGDVIATIGSTSYREGDKATVLQVDPSQFTAAGADGLTGLTQFWLVEAKPYPAKAFYRHCGTISAELRKQMDSILAAIEKAQKPIS
jgi:hypothetical protein